MNIVEAYIKFKGQLLIFISGLPGCGKLTLAKKIAQDFKLKLIDQFDYYKKDYDVKVTLPDGTIVINWYTDDAVDWDKFNKDLNEFKKEGLIVVGFSLPEDKIKTNIDFHIHLNISKQVCMDKRKIFLEKHKDKYEEEYKLIGTPVEKLKMNQLIYPYYLDSTKKSKINKFINMTTMTDEQVYDDAFDKIVAFIQEYLYQSSSQTPTDATPRTPKVSHVSKTTQTQTDESISGSLELLDRPKYSAEIDENINLNMISALSDPDDFDEGDGPIKQIGLE